MLFRYENKLELTINSCKLKFINHMIGKCKFIVNYSYILNYNII